MSRFRHSVPHYLLIPLDHSHLYCTPSPLCIREDEQVTHAVLSSHKAHTQHAELSCRKLFRRVFQHQTGSKNHLKVSN